MARLTVKKFQRRKFQMERDLTIGFAGGALILLGDVIGDILRDQFNLGYYAYIVKLLLPTILFLILARDIRGLKK